MSTQGLGPELQLEDFLLRIVPGLAEQWRGCTSDEIEQIERIAARPLPPFYRWFLTRMGQGMGPLTYHPRLDFSARRVLASYSDELVVPHPQYLLIGHDLDERISLHFFYALDLPARADARVTRRHARGGERHDQYETFRELLAYGALSRFLIGRMPQRCTAMLKSDGPDVLAHLEPVMESLGFTRPVPTGPCCGLYERSDAAMACSKTPRDKPLTMMSFTLGGENPGALRKILGEIATRSSLRIKVSEWDPPLA